MLVGGLNIVGIFAQAPNDMMKGAQMKLKQVTKQLCGSIQWDL